MLPMSSNGKKGLGLLGILALVALILGAISIAVYSLSAFGIADIVPKDEDLGRFVILFVLSAPVAAVALGFLGAKFTDSKTRKGKCLGVALGGVALLAYIVWLVFFGPSD